MARRSRREEDSRRTELLAIDELFVLKGKGDENTFHAWLYDDRPDCCPFCDGAEMKVQGHFFRQYADVIRLGESLKIIDLVYEFFKFHCQRDSCRRIFSAKITFASVQDNVTYRLENKIAELVIRGRTYAGVCAEIQEGLSRQAVGQIFNRWTASRADRRKLLAPPRVIAAVTGRTASGEYTLILSCDDGIRVLDVLLGIDSVRVTDALRRYGQGVSACVITDCDPTVFAAAEEALPKALHIVPAEMWFRQVREDFRDYSRSSLRWVPVARKEEHLMAPPPRGQEAYPLDLRRIFEARPGLKEPYKDYHYLEDAVTNREVRWAQEELDAWPEGLDADFRRSMETSLLQYQVYRPYIHSQEENRDLVPENLLSATDQLEFQLGRRHVFSENVLRALLLFSLNADLDRWTGVPIEDLINHLDSMSETGKGDYDYE